MDNESLDNKEMLETTDSFESTYTSHAQSIQRFLYWRTRDAHVSEDLASRVFEKAWQSRKSFRGGSAEAWLYRIARNVLIDHWRKNKDLVIDDLDNLEAENQPSLAEALDKSWELQNLEKAVESLPETMKLVIKARFIEGRSCKQTSKKLALSESNVRVIQYRALKKLKEYLQ